MFHFSENDYDNEINGAGREQKEAEAQQKITHEEESFKEKFLRLSADYVNFKKRTEKERSDWMLIAQGQIFEELLPLFDELDRAIQLSEKDTLEVPAWLEGFKLIQKNWKKKLADLGIEEIQSSGFFNPEFHEALMQVENSGKPSGEIVQVLSKGYRFKGKVIKHAQVSVAQ